MVVVSRHGNSYRLRWGGSGTLLERLVPVFRLKVAPRRARMSTVSTRLSRSSTTAQQRLAPRRATSNIWSSGLGSTAPILHGSPANRFSKVPSMPSAITGRREHRRQQPAHHLADNEGKIGAWTRYEHTLSPTSMSHTTRGMGLGWMVGLARLVWGLGITDSLSCIYVDSSIECR